MTTLVALAAGAAALVVLDAIICLIAAASVDDDLMAVADAVQVDIDEPEPFVPTDWNAPDVLWLETIGVEL